MSTQPKGILFDMVECLGCRKCTEACMEAHGFDGDPEDVRDLSSTAYTCMVEEDDFPVRNLCRHCLSPTCASACPVGALVKTDLGPVIYDVNRCIGCRYCMVACPFNIPRYEWDSAVPAVRKCNMCFERIEKGGVPACAAACPADATVFGDRRELIAEAHRRIRENPDDYEDHVYGEYEIGGTSVMFLAPHSMETLGYKKILGDDPLPVLTAKVLHRIPGIVLGGGAALLAIWWITRRRDEVALVEGDLPGWPPKEGGNGSGREGRHERN